MRALPQKGGSALIWVRLRHMPSTQRSPSGQRQSPSGVMRAGGAEAEEEERAKRADEDDPSSMKMRTEEAEDGKTMISALEEEESRALEEEETSEAATHWMQGNPGMWAQDLFWMAQNRSPPRAHSLPRHSPPTVTMEEVEPRVRAELSERTEDDAERKEAADNEEEKPPSHTMQGRASVVRQVPPFAPQNASPPSVHSSPRQTGYPDETEDAALKRLLSAEARELRSDPADKVCEEALDARDDALLPAD